MASLAPNVDLHDWTFWNAEHKDFGKMALHIALPLALASLLLIIEICFAIPTAIRERRRKKDARERDKDLYSPAAQVFGKSSFETPKSSNGTAIINLQVEDAGRHGDDSLPQELRNNLQTVRNIVKTPLNSWRQAMVAAFTELSMISFTTLMLATALKRHSGNRMLFLEATGSACLTLAGFCIMGIFRREVVKPPVPLSDATSSETRYAHSTAFRAWVARVAVFFSFTVSCLRFQQAVRHWNAEEDAYYISPVWHGVWVAICGAQTLIALTGFVLFCIPDKSGEDKESLVKEALMQHCGRDEFAALKDCMDVKAPRDVGKSPESQVGLVNGLTFTWMNKVVMMGRTKKMDIRDIFDVMPTMKGVTLYSRFHHIWVNEKSKAKNRWALAKAVFKFINPSFAYASFLKLGYDTLSMFDPMFLNLLINYVQNPEDSSKGVGVFFVVLLACNGLTETALLHQYFHRMMQSGVNVRSALCTAIYEKALVVDRNKLQGEQADMVSQGKIVNMMTTDSQRIADLMSYVQILWSAPYQITIICILLFRQLGLAALGGLIILVLSIPLTAWITQRLRKMQKTVMAEKDRRLKKTTELISGIRAVKIYVWERSQVDTIDAIRARELLQLWKYQLIQLVLRLIVLSLPTLVSVTVFSIYTAGMGYTLDPATAFTSLALFNNLRFPLVVLPNVITSLSEASVTIRRIQDFLMLEELPVKELLPADATQPMVEAKNLSLHFEGHSMPIFTNLSFAVKKGETLIVVGKTGVGKSVLLNTLLGDFTLASGTTTIRGRTAYCSQTAWIQSGTVRDNILFGKEYSRSKYRQTIDACCLTDDLNVLADGDETEIGERGVNLSGGQKQRIALARAVYSEKDVYVFDDVLSAVDAHVAERIFQNVMLGLLKRKTVILVTHRFECLEHANSILFIKPNGALPEKFTSLKEARNSADFCDLAAEIQQAKEEEEQQEQLGSPMRVGSSLQNASARLSIASGSLVTPDRRDTAVSQVQHSPSANAETYTADQISKSTSELSWTLDGSRRNSKMSKEEEERRHLVKEEEMAEGHVQGSVYASYFRAAGGWQLITAVLALLIIGQCASVGANYWLSYWSDRAATMALPKGLGLYSGLQASYIVLSLIALAGLALSAQKASKWFHTMILDKTVHATVGFFESTPIGRLTNKFGRELYVVDENVSQTLYSFVQQVISVLSVIVVICVVLPIVIAVVVPMIGIYAFIERVYVAVARQLKRIDAVTRSPVFSNLSETVEGVKVIKAFRASGQFKSIQLRYLDETISAAYIAVTANRWLAIRLETIGTALVFAVGLTSVLTKYKLNAALSGLAISYAISITNSLNWLVRVSGDRESNVVSVERLIEFNDEEKCPQEDYADDEDALAAHPALPENEGAIEFDSVSLRYRPELPFALRDVSFTIFPGQKVGVVGRTGAGKSSLLVCLLRMVELTDGEIKVGGQPSQMLGVGNLRLKMSVIPQDAVVFTGTLRQNLDPNNDVADDELIWNALRRACLYDYVNSLPEGLNYMVAEGGSNFSVGQKQLICLARVLLRQAKILLLDEATSAVDPQTDALIQRTIRSEFRECTVLTIAHRLKTVIDYDRIIVMGDGRVLEDGAPRELLAKPDGEFASMYRATVAEEASETSSQKK